MAIILQVFLIASIFFHVFQSVPIYAKNRESMEVADSPTPLRSFKKQYFSGDNENLLKRFYEKQHFIYVF